MCCRRSSISISAVAAFVFTLLRMDKQSSLLSGPEFHERYTAAVIITKRLTSFTDSTAVRSSNLYITLRSFRLFSDCRLQRSRVKRSERVGFVSLFFATQPVERKSDHKPDGAEYLRIVSRLSHMKRAHHKPSSGASAGSRTFSLRAVFVVDERCRVDSHEGDEGAEVQHLRALFVSEQERRRSGCKRRPAEHCCAVWRSSGSSEPKTLARQRVAAAHAIQQPRRAELRGHAGAHIRDEQCGIEQVEEKLAADPHRDVDVGGVHDRVRRTGRDMAMPIARRRPQSRRECR